MATVYLSLGSNAGDRLRLIQQALRLLESAQTCLIRVSPVYETEPRDLQEQPWFLNLVAEVETFLSPAQLLTRIHEVERQLGRLRIVSKGPRTIDIDILLFGELVIDSADLTVPHARMCERRFVLQPLADLAPDLPHPVSKLTVRELLTATLGQTVRPFPADPTSAQTPSR
jgi:2-amino-4-hydroxy-6-hydroxymethyldihydropteridine diphosphokinase